MILTEIAPLPVASLPLSVLKDHLRLGSGFAMAPDQDALLESHLRAALSVIERRIAKALLRRAFRLELDRWASPDVQALPLAPVSTLLGIGLKDAAGVVTPVALTRLRLVPDQHRPRLDPATGALPQIPEGGSVLLDFEAGFGAAWADLPADLAQAVLLLAAQFYEYRHDDGGRGPALPPLVASLIERWRLVRAFGGRAR